LEAAEVIVVGADFGFSAVAACFFFDADDDAPTSFLGLFLRRSFNYKIN
jgi:hypothetical protein